MIKIVGYKFRRLCEISLIYFLKERYIEKVHIFHGLQTDKTNENGVWVGWDFQHPIWLDVFCSDFIQNTQKLPLPIHFTVFFCV